MKYFWTNTIWYIILGILTIFELIITIRKVKNRKFVFAFYFTATGITLTIESFLIFIFRAYHYYPKIITTSYFDDELSGNLFSQFSVSATILLFIAFNLKNYWAIILACIYGLIEEVFILLGVYSHTWYKTWITVFGFVVLSLAMKKLYLESLKGNKPILHYLNILIGLFAMDAVTILWGFMLSGYQNYSKDFGYYPLVSPYLLAILYYIFIAIPLITIYFRKSRIPVKATVILGLYISNYIFHKLHIMYFKNNWWFLIFSTVTIFAVYYSIKLLDYLYKSDIYSYLE